MIENKKEENCYISKSLTKSERRRANREERKRIKLLEEENQKKLQETLDKKYMKEALKQAKKAAFNKEVPIGCVIVYEDKIIGRGYNRRNTDKSVLCHAELSAIRKACKKTGDWRLEGVTMYVTLEPCQMCAGAIVQARIPRVVIGCMNPKAGCGGSLLNLLQMSEFNHQCQVQRGVLEEECSEMLQTFFSELRQRLKEEKKRGKEMDGAEKETEKEPGKGSGKSEEKNRTGGKEERKINR